MLGEYRKPPSSWSGRRRCAWQRGCLLWLGRAYGRRAETSNPFSSGLCVEGAKCLAFGIARATNREAIGVCSTIILALLDSWKAARISGALAARFLKRPAEGHYYQAQLDEHRKEYDSAEQHLRTAVELAPRQASRMIDLAKYLANRGKMNESEALFEQAERISPQNPRVLFERASTYVKTGRNLDEARKLLRRYLQTPITPSDPPKSEAEALLRKIGA